MFVRYLIESMSKAGDPRLGQLLIRNPNPSAKFRVAIVGFPCDFGVQKNGGRIGAAKGPSVIHQLLPRLGTVVNPEFNVDLSKIDFQNLGDVKFEATETLEEIHAKLQYIPIVIGGGNDQSFANASALLDRCKNQSIGVVNIDAHLDVRPLIDGQRHSGCPFRLLLEDERFKVTHFQSLFDILKNTNSKFVEFACQGHQCSADHVKYLTDMKSSVKWFSKIADNAPKHFENLLKSEFGSIPTFVSFDIDSIRGSDCPGVSCPSPIGLSANDALEICRIAGRNSATKLIDFSEFNPTIEEDRTARLLVTMIYFFLIGIAERIG